MKRLFYILFFALSIGLYSAQAGAACGATDIFTNNGSSNYWGETSTWSPANVPSDSTENAIISAAGTTGYTWVFPGSYTASCVEVVSGLLALWNQTLTITGDYFKSHTPSGLYYGRTDNNIIMDGTGPQSLEIVGTIPNIEMAGDNVVTSSYAFSTLNAMVLSGTSTIVNFDNDYEIINNSAFTIPTGVTVKIRNGAKFTAGGNVTVNGTLIIESGATLSVASGRTLSVPTGGYLQIDGAPANVGSIDSDGAFAFNVSGTVDLNYFRVAHTSGDGMRLTNGNIGQLSNGEFHYVASGRPAVRLIGTTTATPVWDNVGFFNDDGHATTYSVQATTWTAGTVGAITINNWSGDNGGEANDRDTSCGADSPGCIDWGTAAGTKLTVSNNTAPGNPPTTLNAPSAETLWGTFAFALTASDTATDITEITFTQTGTALASEIGNIRIYRDNGAGNCTYQNTDTLIGTTTLSGSPQTATFSLSPGDIQTNDTTPVCLHLRASISESGVKDHTVRFQLQNTADISNSFGYDFSVASGPPISTDSVRINNGFDAIWKGTGNWNTNGNWFFPLPSATKSCQVGLGSGNTNMNVSGTCENATLLNGGTINFLNTTRTISVRGFLDTGDSYNFLNSANAKFIMNGNTNQSLAMRTAFPGFLDINNTGAASNDIIDVTDDTSFGRDIRVLNGVLRIGSGTTLTSLGDITVSNGASLVIDPGGTLMMGDGATITINTGGTLNIIGTPSNKAVITSTSTADSYNVIINGTVSANEYKIENLGSAGFLVNAAATISATDHFQNGQFNYPIDNSTQMLRLMRQVPTNSIDSISFNSNGSTATGVTNIFTGPAVAAGTLAITNYSGDLSGETNDAETNYLVDWSAPVTTIDFITETNNAASFPSGSTQTMGVYSFKLSDPGTFNDTDILSIRVTQTGTASGADVDEVRVYQNTACNGTGGVLIGSGTISGVPASATFSITAGDLIVEDHPTTPPKSCFYIEYDIDSLAANGLTVGAKIDVASHVTNSEGYVFSASTSFPVTSGAPGEIITSDSTTWIGTTSIAWLDATNWTNGVPNQTLNCIIPFQANNPTISTGTQRCKNIEVTSGHLTMTDGALEIFGGLINTGTITQNGRTIEMQDDYTNATDQVVSSTTPLELLRFDKRAGGTVSVGGTTLSIGNLLFTTGESFTFRVPSGKTLEVDNNINIRSGITFQVTGGGTVKIAANRFLQNLGGVLQATGINDAFPQSTSNKATFTSKSGRFRMRATAGTVSLVGFIIDNLNVEGLRIEGSSNLTNLDGGQFINMQPTFTGTVVRGLRLNTTATISETIASNVGFMFGPANSVYSGSPLPTDNYNLVYANNCGSQTLTFDQWFGNFYGTTPQPVTEDKLFDLDDSAANTCQINMDVSASPVSLVGLDATPYNGTIDVEWETAAEVNHYGFNVFRSQNINSNFTQINPSLIRNFQHSHLGQGNYIFRDNQVINGQVYYYYIQDVGADGSKTMHGPVFAQPLASLGTAPSYTGSESGTGENNENGGDSSDPNNIGNSIDLGGGITVLSKTINSLKIEINPASMTFTPATWDASYDNVAISSYGETNNPGIAQTLERVLLIEVNPGFTTASLSDFEIAESSVQNKKLSPSPEYVLNSGTNVLEPHYSEDATYYALNTYEPNQYFSIEPNLVTQGQKKFLKVIVLPVKYNPTNQLVKQATHIVLDIGLDGNAWDWQPESNVSYVTPEAFSNVLKIKFNKTGIHEISYSELESAGLEGPFEGADTNDFRMYFEGKEIPIEIEGGSTFDSGSSVKFFASFTETLEDHYNEIILSPRGVYNETDSPLRVEAQDSTPDENKADVGTHSAQVTYEQDIYFQEDLPVGGHVEHVYWKQLNRQQGTVADANAQLDISADITGLDINSSRNINIIMYVRGRPAITFNPKHSLDVYVNGSLNGSVSFESKNYRAISLSVPLTDFVEGANTIRVEASDATSETGDYNLVDIDKVSIAYPKSNAYSSGQLVINNQQLGDNITAYDFDNSPDIYDVSNPYSVFKISNAEESTDGGKVSVRFNALNLMGFGSNGEPTLTGSKFAFVDSSTALSPIHMDLSSGYSTYMRDLSLGADLIIIAPKNLLATTDKLAERRRSQGFRVVQTSLEQIFDEFSSGRKSTQAIKDFLFFAHKNWKRPAVKYALFVGDSTNDYKDKLNTNTNLNKWPARMIHGKHLDFSSDQWFVTPQDETTGLFSTPIISIGRIPTSNAVEIDAYINKVIGYENEDSQPEQQNINSFVFISDNDQRGEQFFERNTQLAGILSDQNGSLSSSVLNRADYASGNDLKVDILNTINNDTPLMMTYYGHGAEDRWGDSNYFNITDLGTLTNSKLPMVLALNCANSSFSSHDDSVKSLGEELIKSDNGAVNFFGSSSLTSPGDQMTLSISFMEEMSNTTKSYFKGQRIGDVIFKAQSSYPVNSGNQDVLLSWTFLGDPSMPMPVSAFSGVAPNSDLSDGSGGCGLVKTPPGNNPPGMGLLLFAMFLLPLSVWTRFRFKTSS